MHKRIVPVIFILAIAALAVAFVSKRYLSEQPEKVTGSRVVAPQVTVRTEQSSEDSFSMSEETTLSSLVSLRNDETLLSIVSMDFNGDGYEDQVNSIRTASSPYIQLLVGLYNPSDGKYERSAVIATTVTQVRTFTYTGIDLTGDHRTALVYQGYTETGNSVLQAFFIRGTASSATLQQIASFETDGSIYVQQMDRYDAYERSQAAGASYPIWVYSTDTNSANNDQLQTQYDWSSAAGQYVLVSQKREAGVRLAAREFERIQDGTIETFASFLDGLWHKTDAASDKYYLFFDYDSSEIIFFQSDSEEVYTWVNSYLRRNGIYLTTINQGVENLQRRVDVSLRSLDTVYIRLQDDLRMLIGENSSWDGEYKKVSAGPAVASVKARAADYISELTSEPSWTSADGTVFKFISGSYTAIGDSISDNGLYTSLQAFGKPYLQLRSNTGTSLTGTYALSYGSTGSETIILQPCRLTPTDEERLEQNPLILTRQEE
ncbi:MAG: pallilysin-related adhesin [Treponema sp.]|nr:pallilysin-related adhesin [Treponema sp.]